MEPALCFESRNRSCVKIIYPLSVRVTLYVILGVITVMTVFGNLLVIASIIYFKQLHTPTNLIILSLSLTDLLVGTIVMFPRLTLLVETCWYFGDFFCKVALSIEVMVITASILNMSFIAVDRYFAVCQPLLYKTKITVHVVAAVLVAIWGVSALTGFGIVFLQMEYSIVAKHYYTHISCEGECFLFQTALSSTLSSSMSFYLPGIVMLCIYLKILLVAQRQARSLNNHGKKNSKKMSNPSQMKATKTLAIILGTFLFFWTPFFICVLITNYISEAPPPHLFDTLIWLGYFNSTVNPLIYALFYSWFRKAIRLLISCKVFTSDISDTKLYPE